MNDAYVFFCVCVFLEGETTRGEMVLGAKHLGYWGRND